MPLPHKLRIMVPRLVDIGNLNAQNLNAKALLQRFHDDRAQWYATTYGEPDPGVAINDNVNITKLLPWRLWRWHMAANYMRRVDAIFYPNKEVYDKWGLRLHQLTHARVPIILTLEGLTGTPERERQLTEWAGHPVACFKASDEVLSTTDAIYRMADHIIAISPFMADMGRRLFGDKVSMIPLGVDLDTFKPADMPKQLPPTVLAVGSVYERKRPEVFLDIAMAHPAAQFRWLGDGQLRQPMIEAARARSITNVEFPGARTPAQIATEMQKADLLVLPSQAEGVPKVIQEAAACGLPIVLFGHYCAPSVVHGENGFVAWTDLEMSRYVGTLLAEPAMRRRMAADGIVKARKWNWATLAPQWEAKIIEIVEQYAKRRTLKYGT